MIPQLSPAIAAGVISFLLAGFAVYFEPFRVLLTQKASEIGIVLPLPCAIPTVYDANREIKYLGSLKFGIEHYQNIFYAEDTSGQNRFAPPVKFIPAAGSTVDATKPGAWCPQGTGDVLPFTSRVTNISENCLSLRVARVHASTANSRVPVVVWLHGGGHALGSGYDILYEPDGLVKRAAADGRPLIWVAINYRLGFFGFATSKALVESKHTNAGLRDQRAALEWVRDNIEVFGGDPNQVTVIGQSVGASDISLQLTSWAGKRGVPFSKAVMMSGSPGLNFNTKSDLVANNTAFIAESIGCVEDGNAQSQATIACLRGASSEELTDLSVTAMRTARPPFGEAFFYPTYDGDFLPDRPSELIRAGKFVKGIPIIASWVTNDGAWYASPTTNTDDEVLSSFGLWLTGLTDSNKDQLLKLYPLADFEHMVRPEIDGPVSPQYYRAAQMNKDFWFTCPVLDFTWQYVKQGGAERALVRVYEHNATRFAPAFKMMGVPMWRVAHLSDVPYVLNNQVIGDTSTAQLELSQVVSTSIIEFVATGTFDPPEAWPAAFQGVSEKDFEAEFPSLLSLKLFGGPHVSQSVTVSKSRKSIDGQPGQALDWERLFDRCEFINSVKVREEVGV